MKLKSKSKGKFVGLSSFIAAFALLGTAVLCPFDGNNASAATQSTMLRIDFVLREALASGRLTIDFFLNSSGGIDYENIARKLGIDFYLKGKINLGITGLGNADGGTVTPTVGGTTVEGRTKFTAGTNDNKGLAMKVSGSETMTNENYTNSVISATKGATSVAALGKDEWGYRLTETNADTNGDKKCSLPTAMSGTGFVGVKADGEVFTCGTGDHIMDLNFGAKVSTGVAAGTYSSTVSIQVASDAKTLASGVSNLNAIDEAIQTLKDEDPEFARAFDEAQAKAKADYEARMNGGVVEETEVTE